MEKIKHHGFEVPDGYFEQLGGQIFAKTITQLPIKPKNQVGKFSFIWLAASIFLIIGGLIVLKNSSLQEKQAIQQTLEEDLVFLGEWSGSDLDEIAEAQSDLPPVFTEEALIELNVDMTDFEINYYK